MPNVTKPPGNANLAVQASPLDDTAVWLPPYRIVAASSCERKESRHGSSYAGASISSVT